jgi:hypothetical protein
MHGPTVFHPQTHHRSPVRDLDAHLRGWSRSENLLATFSLAVLVSSVLALLYQAMAV